MIIPGPFDKPQSNQGIEPSDEVLAAQMHWRCAKLAILILVPLTIWTAVAVVIAWPEFHRSPAVVIPRDGQHSAPDNTKPALGRDGAGESLAK